MLTFPEFIDFSTRNIDREKAVGWWISMAIRSSCRLLLLVALPWSAITNGATTNLPISAAFTKPSLLNETTTHSLANFPPGFEVRVSYGDHQFQLNDLLRNGIAALYPLALRHAAARTAGVHYYFRRVGDMVLDVQPTHPATDVSNEIALLCIYFGIKASLTDQRYFNARYDCISDDVEVAHVTLEPAGYRLSSKSLKKSPGMVAGLREPGGTSTNDRQITNSSLEAFTSKFDFRPNGQTLTITAVFLTAMTAIVHWGLRPKTARLAPYTAISPGREWDSHLFLVESTPPREVPPYFESRWAIEMARQLPFFCAQSHTFAELDSIVTVDGVDVGAGLLRKALPNDFTSGRDGKVFKI